MDRDLSPYKNLSEYSNLHRKQAGLVQTSVGAYDIDLESAYLARKQRRDPSGDRPKSSSISPKIGQMYQPRGIREELLQSCENKYERERSRSKSNERNVLPGPEPRTFAPMPTQNFNYEEMQIFREPKEPKSRDAKSREPKSRELSLEPKKDVSITEKKNLALSEDEIVTLKAFIWTCGKNSDGELGLGFKDGEICLPRNVDQLRDFPLKQIAASSTHTVLLTPHGDVHVTGSSLHGKLGL
jgi:hypothetical protein